MTPDEFNYIKRAVEALESPGITPMAQHKILKTMSQICGKNATVIEQQLTDSVDVILDRRYQDLQNQKLVDILSR
ncbi:MAG: hypothetical protein ACO29Y_05750 [Holophagaceae bacterium]